MKTVYFFGNGKAEGNKDQKNLLGGKGANLAEMTNIGLPVPAGFTISTEVCLDFVRTGKYPKSLNSDVNGALAKLERSSGKRFGDANNPLLVSVRSGARASMPGMMDTVLNLGLNDETVQGVISMTQNSRFAYDAYRRFVSMYGDVVLELKPTSKEERDPFEEILEAKKKARGVTNDTDLSSTDLKQLVAEFKTLVLKRTGKPFPEDPRDQLWERSAPSSARGTTRARSPTASSTRSPIVGERRSTSNRWSSATWARTRAPASPSPAIRPPARTFSMASS